MKKITIILILVSFINASFANKDYHEAMSQSIEKLFKASIVAEYIETANQFERIARMDKEEWLPLYYASYAYIMISYQEPDYTKKDAYLDQAQKYLDQAIAIEPDESELHMLQGFLYPSRITIDPLTRGMEYMEKMNASLDKALQLNPDNPRVYFLRGTMTYHMPEAYGGGVANALPLLKTAQEKFNIFKPETDLSPNWGKEGNETDLKKALEELKE